LDSLSPVPRYALTRAEAAASLGMSLDSFEHHVQPHLKVIRLGRVRVIATEELAAWARKAGEEPLR
jgi:hypothetical protein